VLPLFHLDQRCFLCWGLGVRKSHTTCGESARKTARYTSAISYKLFVLFTCVDWFVWSGECIAIGRGNTHALSLRRRSMPDLYSRVRPVSPAGWSPAEWCRGQSGTSARSHAAAGVGHHPELSRSCIQRRTGWAGSQHLSNEWKRGRCLLRLRSWLQFADSQRTRIRIVGSRTVLNGQSIVTPQQLTIGHQNFTAEPNLEPNRQAGLMPPPNGGPGMPPPSGGMNRVRRGPEGGPMRAGMTPPPPPAGPGGPGMPPPPPPSGPNGPRQPPSPTPAPTDSTQPAPASPSAPEL